MEIIILCVVWVVAIIAIAIMKKIEPDNKIYAVWALFNGVLFTIYTICYLHQ